MQTVTLSRWSNLRSPLLWLENLSARQTFVLIFGLSFVARWAVIIPLHLFTLEKTEATSIAMSLAATGQFANPNFSDTGPTAHLAPVYPFILGAFYWLLGGGLAFSIARLVLSTTLTSLQYALLPYAAGALGLPRITGVIAGLAASLLPVRMWIETSGGHETALASVACIWLVSFTLRSFSEKAVSRWREAICGIGWGIGILINPVFSVVLTVTLVLLLTTRRSGLRSAALILGCAVLVTSTWIVRTYLVLGRIVPVRSNFGLELSVSNDDRATAVMDWNVTNPEFKHPFSNRTETEKMRALGEIAYYRLRQQQAIQWIRAHPRRFVELTAERLLFFWFSPAAGPLKNAFMMLLTLGGFIGLFLLHRRNPFGALVLLSLWLIYQAPYYFVQVSWRYRYPIDWSFWILCGYAFWQLSRIRQRAAAAAHRVLVPD